MKKLILLTTLFFTVCFKMNGQSVCRPNYGTTVIWCPIDSFRVAYTDAGKGPVLLFVHDLLGNIGSWQQNIPALSRMGFRCIAVDLPGYGASSKIMLDSGKTQMDFYASVIDAFAQKLELKKVTLVGQGMGGQIAILNALQQPKWLKQVVVAGPNGLEPFEEPERDLLLAFATPRYHRYEDSLRIVGTTKRLFSQMPASAQQLVDERIALMECEDFDKWCKTVALGTQGMLQRPLKEQLPLIKLPVLLMFGEKDRLIPSRLLHPDMKVQEVAKVATDRIKKCRLQWMPEAGHMMQWEQPQAFNEAVRSFAKP